MIKIIFMLVMMFVPTLVVAGGAHSNNTTNNYYTNSLSGKTGGAALGLAATQCKHDWGAKSLQGCVGVSSIDDTTGKAFGLGYRVGNFLINGVVAEEDSLVGAGVGLNFHF